MNPKIESLYQQIGTGIYSKLPENGWKTAWYSYLAIELYSFSTGRYLLASGEEKSISEIENEVFDAFESLRTEMAKLHANGHVWYTATFTVTPDGNFKFDFDYDHLPAFDIMPSPNNWLDEFKAYPRPELQAQIQDWIDGKITYSEADEEKYNALLQRLKDLQKK